MKNTVTKTSKSKPLFKELYVAPLPQSHTPLYTAGFFSGVRGIDIGAKKAGFTSLFQSDFWHPAGRAFELNIPVTNDLSHPAHLHSEGVFLAGPRLGDITKINYNLMQQYIFEHLDINIPMGGLDVIHGGPPCQGFSKANNYRGEHNLKNYLIFQMLEIIRHAKPKVGLIEQVPDLLSPKFKQTWNRIKLVLNSMTDYHWSVRIMNAMHYGARQNRKRAIIMLVRKDLGVLPSFPSGTEPNLDKVSVHSLLPHVYHFSPGQFADKIKDARKHVFCTMTATGSEYLFGFDGKRRKPVLYERLVLTELEGLKLYGIPYTHQKTLVGNMVQVSFAEALFRHIRTNILRA